MINKPLEPSSVGELAEVLEELAKRVRATDVSSPTKLIEAFETAEEVCIDAISLGMSNVWRFARDAEQRRARIARSN